MNDLLCDVYSCAEAPERWRGLLDRVCDRLSVRSAVLQLVELRGGRLHRLWEARDTYSLVHRERHDLILNNDENPRLRARRPIPASSRQIVIRDEDVFLPGSADLAELKARLAALELGHDLCGMTELAQGRHVALVVHRAAADHRQMGADEEMLISGLLPHVRQTLQLTDQLQRARRRGELLARASEMLGTGVVLCGPAGRVSWANADAQTMLDRSPYLSARGGRIRATAPADRTAFEGLLADAAKHGMHEPPAPVRLTLGRHDVAEMVQVLAAGVRGEAATLDEAEVLLLLCRPGRPLQISPEGLSELFGLSGAEARLTAGLCQGQSVTDYAQSRGVSVGTARVQLKRAMAKTRSARQSDLVRRVCASLAVNLEPEPRDFPSPPSAKAKGARRGLH